MTFCYDDIISLPHPRSRRAPMPQSSRAAQFAPFAALSGYEDAIGETARLTDCTPQSTEDSLALMDEKIHALLEIIGERPQITLTCFEPDAHKSGGAYVRISGRIRRVDTVNRSIILTDRTVIPMDSVCEIDCVLQPDAS